ncbi:ABC transporter ATP-binding protein [Kitasatospora sp. NPDC101235]|uniref:ABC transporter ATP-binding protein n=1 Tax=Kitasatospora sp. NPDC101235 TaxID=3364101 RepID=UPI0038192F61
MPTQQTEAAVTITALHKSYGKVRAVDGLDLELAHGSTVALLGPNGSGKSTTVNTLLGLLGPDSGSVRVYGHEPAVAVSKGLVGAMLQQGAYPNSAKVKEVLNLARNLYPEPQPLDRLAETANLTDLLDRKVNNLSGGQVQRVRFAFALAGNPKLLVMDEPTVGLDADARQLFWQGVRRFAADGRTVLFSTHYLEEADAAADRIVVMSDGKLAVDSTGEEIKHRFTSRTVSFSIGTDSSEGLDRLPGVLSVEIHGDRAHLRTSDSDATVNELLATRGPVRELELSGGSLEDAFLSLTSAAAKNQEA